MTTGDGARGAHTRIPEEAYDLFDGPNFAHLATVMADGAPHVTPMWQERQGDQRVLLNTNRGRTKARNLQRDPRVALSIRDQQDPFRYVQVRGRASLREEGALEDVNRLSEKYVGGPYRPLMEGEVRVAVLVDVEHVYYRPRR